MLTMLIAAAVAVNPPVCPDADPGSAATLAKALASAHQPYDFEEKEEQAEFRKLKQLLTTPGAEALTEARTILERRTDRELAFTVMRRNYFSAKLKRAELSLAEWKDHPDAVVERHLKTVLASAAMVQSLQGHGAPQTGKRPVHTSETLEAERRFRAAAVLYRKEPTPERLTRLREDIRCELARRAEELPYRIPELRKAVEHARARELRLSAGKQQLVEQQLQSLIMITQTPSYNK